MTMDEYIKREALREKIASLTIAIFGIRAGKGILNDYMKQYRESVLRIVDELASEDVEPVRHGRWETAYVEDWDGTMVYEHYHRDCDYVFRNYLTHGSPYCPNCGAKMDL